MLLSGRPLVQALPSQRPSSSLSAQDGESRGAPLARRRSRFHPLTPLLAQKELPYGSKVSKAKLSAVPKQWLGSHNGQSQLLSSLPLHTQRDTHAAADAQGSKAALGVAGGHFMQQRHQHAST